VSQLEAELDVDVALVVYCPDAAVAGWYHRLCEPDGSSLLLRPFIFTPDEVLLVVAKLDIWLRRAVTATTADEVVRDS
jgi:hypothetical protein